MSEFQAQLNARMQEGLRRLEEEAATDRRFRDSWEEVRRAKVRPRLDEAAEAIRRYDGFGQAKTRDTNGASMLEVYTSMPPREPDFALTLTPRYKEREVVCEAIGVPLPGETFTPESLSSQTVEAKILSFLEAIFDHLVGTRLDG